MVKSNLMTVATAAAIFSATISAHPGHSLEEEIAERSAYLKRGVSNLNHCADKLQARGYEKRSINRRVAKVQELRDEVLRKKRSLMARQESGIASSTAVPTDVSASGAAPSDASGAAPTGSSGGDAGGGGTAYISDFGATVANTSHESSLDVTPWTTDYESVIYGNSSCILNPEGETGPYYVQGEFVRHDITEAQPGVPVYLEEQFINVNTCEPITSIYADIWHCNSTGVYAGVVANGNGNENDTANINATFLRGIQKTDSDGVAGWRTIFPGYYSGRATHIHMITHTNVTVLANDTISGGTIRHIGQVFYDQDLIDYINDNVYPYTTNTITPTDNDEDRVFITETNTDSDPVLNYVLLGEKVEDGLFAWITIGVDPDSEYTTSAASVLTDEGGYSTGNSEVV
ncbi:extracellular dioxygenase [Exophiala viscosa]|uniref:extracellular dioxygenase n=1 Tax=Exophiala viscosa TaxID=2486360 RepID=UPI002193255C|nr:extracellular dioxygenase [Exophiala viscosa]